MSFSLQLFVEKPFLGKNLFKKENMLPYICYNFLPNYVVVTIFLFQHLYISRFLGTLKSYVRNRACPEGSIAEAYIVNECLTFCSMYLQGIETQFNQEERNYDVAENGGLPIFSQRFRPIGGEIYGSLTEKELNLAHWYVLNNCEEAKSYIE